MLTEKELEILRRRMRGESQRTIADALGISQAAVSKFETNSQRKILDAEELLRIARELGITVEDGLAGKRVAYAKRGGKR